jgi:plastocyanin
MRDLHIALGLVIVTAASGVACRGGDETRHTETTGATPNVVTVTATDYAFEAPDTLQEGWNTVRLVNDGHRFHAALVVKLGQEQTVEGFRAAYSEAWKTNGPWDAFAFRNGLVSAAPNGSISATLYLGPGRYAWYCPMHFEGGAPHVFEHDMARPFVVTARRGSDGPPVAPEPSAVIALADYAFIVSEPLAAGQHVIRVENQGREPHEVLLFKLAPENTLDDAQSWLGDPRSAYPFSSYLGGAVVEPAGFEAYFEAELTTGDYVLICTFRAPDGRPHTEHGMIRQIRIA